MAIPTNFSARNTDSQINAQWWIAIDGLRYRYGTCEPTWNPTNTSTNQTIKSYMSELITTRPQRVEPLNGKTTSHGITVQLVDVDDEITALFSVHDNTNKAWTTVASDCTASATTLTVTATSAFSAPCDIYLGGETMRATSATTFTFAVERGMYGSQAEDHLTTDDAGLVHVIEVWDAPRYITGRGVTLYECRDELVEADAIKMRCVIDSIRESAGVWTISASGHLSKMAAQIYRDATWKYIERKSNGFIVVFGGNGTLPTPTAYLKPWVQFGEKFYEYTSVTSFDYFPDWDVIVFNPQPVYLIPQFGVAGSTGGDDMGSVTANSGKVSGFGMEFVQGDTIHLVCSHTLFYNGSTSLRDPISVILCLLLSKDGDGSNHATYDVLPGGMGLGWPSAWVDIAGMEALRDSTNLKDAQLSFVINSGEDAKKWIEENILRPNLLFFVERWDGTVGIDMLVTQNGAIARGSSLTIDESVLVAVPNTDISTYPIGEITWKFNWEPISDEFRGEIKTIFQESYARHNANARRYELECKTCYDPSYGVGNRVMAQSECETMPTMLGNYITTIWDRFAVNQMPVLLVEVPYNRLTNCAPGNCVQVSCAGVPDLSDSTRGISLEWFQIVEAHPNPKTSSVKLTLWQIGVHDANYVRYAPSARMVSKSDDHEGTGKCQITCTTAQYTFAANGGDLHQFAEGDKVRFYTSTYVSLDSRTYTIDKSPASLANTALLTEASLKFAVTAGYIMDTANYDECVSHQTTNWGYQSDTADRLGAANAEGKNRS